MIIQVALGIILALVLLSILGPLLRFFLPLVLVGAALAWFYFGIPELYAMAFGGGTPLWESLLWFAYFVAITSIVPAWALWFAWIIARGV